ncbi:acyl-CoA carboxylase subunit beta [Limisalsivibrio acetivorans]|uniref:acyl-CoA carboxylase subunit beta n=1 Tax=Limisalsivibrio acetivorans TaxID=1304888 RepID=UPI0003B4CF03|nr:acyl-CoA carboxylase subunit beta [Limisalsivibrio acetivorans]
MADKKLKELLEKRAELYKGGGEEKIKKHHDQGKLTARERLGLLFDQDTFQETRLFAKHRCTAFGQGDKEFPADGVVTGCGLVNGKAAYAASQDFTVAGGTVGESGADKIREVMENALKTGDPFIFINDSGGARIQEGVDALSGYGKIFYRNVLLSGVVPQISIIAGPCAGGAAYSPALTDFIVQIRREGQMYITGPKIIKEVTGEDVTSEELGGVESHSVYSGVVHFSAENGYEAMNITKRLLTFLPSNNTEDPPYYPECDEQAIPSDEYLNTLVPSDTKQPYDMHDIIQRIVTGGDFMEVMEHFAPNIIIGFGRLNGSTVGVVANQPMSRAGVLDINSSDKAARFIRFCNAFNIPILTLVDVPGFLPGLDQEYGGIIRHGAKMLFAYAAATVPKITVIVRKAYGGAYLAMCSKEMGADRVYAWPTAEVAVMGAEGASKILFKKELEEAEDKDAKRAELIEKYKEEATKPYIAASRGYIDDIIEPAYTKGILAQDLQILKTKRDVRPQKKHGLIPL